MQRAFRGAAAAASAAVQAARGRCRFSARLTAVKSQGAVRGTFATIVGTTKTRKAMNISELCNPFVAVVQRATPLADAARLMREHHVGSLVVVDETGKGRVPVGILTDRDIVVAVVAREVDPRALTAGDVMSADLATVRPGDSAVDTLALMRRRGVRRVPVVAENGTLAGIVTVDDLLAAVAEQLGDVVRAIAAEQAHETRART
jgi:CBS domain-containing protein